MEHQENSQQKTFQCTTISKWPSDSNSRANFRSEYEKSSWFSRLHFLHVIPYITTVRRKGADNINLNDLPDLGKSQRVDEFEKLLASNYLKYQEDNPNRKPSLLKPLIKTYKNEIIYQFITQILFFSLRLLNGWLLYRLLVNITVVGSSITDSFIAAIPLLISIIFSIYCGQQAYFNVINLVIKCKGSIVALIYSKINKVSLHSLHSINLGKVLNIVANDINTLDKTYNLFALILMPFTLIGGGAILWQLYGPVSLIGFAVIFVTFPIQKRLATSSAPFRKEKNKTTDERVKMTNELIEGIRLLKLYTWEMIFKKDIEEIRKKELSLLRKLANIEGSQRALAFGVIMASTFIIFVTYIGLGGEISIAQVYSTLLIMLLISQYGVFIPAMGIALLIEAKIMFNRILSILELPEIQIHSIENQIQLDSNIAVQFVNFYGYWTNSQDTADQSDENNRIRKNDQYEPPRNVQVDPENPLATYRDKPALENISLSIPKGGLTAIVGRTGCGKSSLMLSLTGEMPRSTGTIRYNGKIAYVEQEPTIFSGTIRDNIIFGNELDEPFYSEVIKACCLKEDLKSFHLGDLTQIGERGITLSGGQKARISLARAIYSRADIYLLDDPLSAVDSKVARKIYDRVITGLLLGKTVIIVTHQIHFLTNVRQIIYMEHGALKAQGTYQDLNSQGCFDYAKEFRRSSSLGEDDASDFLESTRDEEHEGEEREHPNLYKDENPKTGSVTWATYKQYIESCLTKRSALILGTFFCFVEALNISYGRVLGIWAYGQLSNSVAIPLEGSFVLLIALIFFIKIRLYIRATLRGSKKLQKEMMDTIIMNRVEYFDTNPVGRILNRFSNDVGAIDRHLPMYLLDVTEGCLYIMALYIACWIMDPYLVISSALAIIGFFLIMKFITTAVIRARQLELVSRSPMYSFFSLTISGLICVRSFHQSENFKNKFRGLLNDYLKACFAFGHSNRFMAFMIDLTSSLTVILGLCIIIMTKNQTDLDKIGQAAAYLLLLSEQVQYILRQSITVNLYMSSTARIISCINDSFKEGPLEDIKDATLRNEGWPRNGKICFKNVFMRYRADTDHVIKDLSFQINPGEKIGCVGRTGAGKSSILQIIFRMVEIDQVISPDSQVTIDDIDIKQIGLHLLRSKLSIIPQNPVMFSGTVRKNLDPLRCHTDLEIWTALDEVGLREFIEGQEKQLDTVLSNDTQILSVGQKQLICLARAILIQAKVIVLDEATANVDFETDALVQKILMEKYRDKTVITIAHRLTTIAAYDKVLVMHKGKLIEFDSPYLLMAEKIGDDEITANTHFSHMVQNAGSLTALSIFNTAKEKYFQKIILH